MSPCLRTAYAYSVKTDIAKRSSSPNPDPEHRDETSSICAVPVLSGIGMRCDTQALQLRAGGRAHTRACVVGLTPRERQSRFRCTRIVFWGAIARGRGPAAVRPGFSKVLELEGLKRFGKMVLIYECKHSGILNFRNSLPVRIWTSCLLVFVRASWQRDMVEMLMAESTGMQISAQGACKVQHTCASCTRGWIDEGEQEFMPRGNDKSRHT